MNSEMTNLILILLNGLALLVILTYVAWKLIERFT